MPSKLGLALLTILRRSVMAARHTPYVIGAMGAMSFSASCGRDSRAATPPSDDTTAASPLPARCGHTACGDNFFVDVASIGPCTVGATCSVALTLVATGDYHINDEYPYKLKAEDASGVAFSGTDAAGKNVFSKAAGNWTKRDERTGTMNVAFQPIDKGSKAIGGVFKLSVCSSKDCQLEQQQVMTTVVAR